MMIKTKQKINLTNKKLRQHLSITNCIENNSCIFAAIIATANRTCTTLKKQSIACKENNEKGNEMCDEVNSVQNYIEWSSVSPCKKSHVEGEVETDFMDQYSDVEDV